MFTVKIPKTENVSILKKMIKEENAHLLNHVDASDLELSQVSLPVDDKLEDAVNSVHLEPLNPLERLLNLFHSTEDNHLQIVVQAPTDGGPISSFSASQKISLISCRGPGREGHRRRKQGSGQCSA